MKFNHARVGAGIPLVIGIWLVAVLAGCSSPGGADAGGGGAVGGTAPGGVSEVSGAAGVPGPAARATRNARRQTGHLLALNPGPTALDRYVAAPDPSYKWSVVESVEQNGLRLTVLDMTSQTWLTSAEVNRPEWRHRMVVAQPSGVTSTTALLLIGGGSNDDTRPRRPRDELVATALGTGTVVAELGMVPNQPLIFNGDGQERVEDDLIAYTWDKYLRTGDERWPARLPMTKAAVRAMDTVTAFCASAAGGGLKVDSFVVAGGSKRGWTTWTTAIVDPRVVAIAPIVIDVLNVEASMLHHYQAYGFFAPAVGDYVRHGIMDWMGTPEMDALQQIEDPFLYRDRLRLPKLLINAGGDQFFLPDSSRFYFEQLEGPKYLRYVPNADHSLRDSDAMETLVAWHHAITRDRALPRFQWTHLSDGQIRLETLDVPEAISVWKVTNPLVRDFRLETIGPAWSQFHVMLNPEGVYDLSMEDPGQGWRAWFVELVYDVGAPRLLKLTTDVRVLPATLPHPAYEPAEVPKGFLQGGRGR